MSRRCWIQLAPPRAASPRLPRRPAAGISQTIRVTTPRRRARCIEASECGHRCCPVSLVGRAGRCGQTRGESGRRSSAGSWERGSTPAREVLVSRSAFLYGPCFTGPSLRAFLCGLSGALTGDPRILSAEGRRVSQAGDRRVLRRRAVEGWLGAQRQPRELMGRGSMGADASRFRGRDGDRRDDGAANGDGKERTGASLAGSAIGATAGAERAPRPRAGRRAGARGNSFAKFPEEFEDLRGGQPS